MCCQCRKVGFQWSVGVKIADHRDASEQITQKSAEVEFPVSEVFTVLLDA